MSFEEWWNTKDYPARGRKMTDEEMANKYAEKQNLQNVNPSGIVRYKLSKAFLAGLKTGRPKWHFVSKEGFPSKDDIYLIIRNDGLHLGDYCCGGDGDIDCQSWCDYPSEEEIQDDSVIAWKEIVLPELKESE